MDAGRSDQCVTTAATCRAVSVPLWLRRACAHRLGARSLRAPERAESTVRKCFGLVELPQMGLMGCKLKRNALTTQPGSLLTIVEVGVHGR